MNNIILIGMPGSGKSTIGVLLARRLSKDFVDTDLLIQNRQGLALQEIVDRFGHLRLREVEERVILSLEVENAIVATGGSAVYSARAMAHLRRVGKAFYLKVDVPELLRRLRDIETRGIARSPGQSFGALYREREALYLSCADETVDCRGMGHEEVVAEVIRAWKKLCPGEARRCRCDMDKIDCGP